MPGRLPLRALECFEACARTASFAEAARELGLSRSAVSHQIAQLEDRLSTALIERRRDGWQLTRQGHALAERVRVGLGSMRDAVEALERSKPSPTITLSAPPLFASVFLSGDPAKLMPARYRTRLELAIEDRMVDLKDAQCAVRFGSGRWRGLKAEQLLRFSTAPVCSPAVEKRLKGVDAPVTRLVFSDESLGWRAWEGQWNTGAKKGPVIRFDSFSAALRACLGGQGLLIGPIELLSEQLARRELVRPFEGQVPSAHAFYFVAKPEVFDQPPVIALRASLKRRIGQEVAD